MKHIIIILFLLINYALSAQTFTQAERDSINALFKEEPYPFVFYSQQTPPKPLNWDELVRQIIGYPSFDSRIITKSPVFMYSVLVDEDGCYLTHIRLRPKNIPMVYQELNKKIETFLPQTVFSPAIKNGIVVKAWINLPLIMCFQ